jgi:hypothetical protein
LATLLCGQSFSGPPAICNSCINDSLFLNMGLLGSPSFSFDKKYFCNCYRDLPFVLRYHKGFQNQFDPSLSPYLDTAKHLAFWAGTTSGIIFLAASTFFLANNFMDKPIVNRRFAVSLAPLFLYALYDYRKDMIHSNSYLSKAIDIRNASIKSPKDTTARQEWTKALKPKTSHVIIWYSAAIFLFLGGFVAVSHAP